MASTKLHPRRRRRPLSVFPRNPAVLTSSKDDTHPRLGTKADPSSTDKVANSRRHPRLEPKTLTRIRSPRPRIRPKPPGRSPAPPLTIRTDRPCTGGTMPPPRRPDSSTPSNDGSATKTDASATQPRNQPPLATPTGPPSAGDPRKTPRRASSPKDLATVTGTGSSTTIPTGRSSSTGVEPAQTILTSPSSQACPRT